MYITKNRIIRLCVTLAILTSSFDIFLNLVIGGLSFRFSQFIILPVIAMYFCEKLRELSQKKFTVYEGELPLIAWAIIQFGFTFRSPNYKNAIGYWLWLALSIFTLLALEHFCGRAYSFRRLARVYLNCFTFVGAFGLLQFVMYPLGVNLLAAQRWNGNENSSFSRINGFCYEPSYFVTYMMVAFVAIAYLLEKHDESVFSRRGLIWREAVISLSMFLSASRMGWFIAGAYLLIRLAKLIWDYIAHGTTKARAIFLAALPIIIIGAGWFILRKVNIDFLLETLFHGFGILDDNSGSGSTMHRLGGLWNCVDIFIHDPWLGYSLGGVDPAIVQHNGDVYTSAYNGAAMSIVGEILVANGAVVMWLYLGYVIFMIYKGLRAKNTVCAALAWGVAFEMIILCFNQNILRIYVWISYAVLRCAITHLPQSEAELEIELGSAGGAASAEA